MEIVDLDPRGISRSRGSPMFVPGRWGSIRDTISASRRACPSLRGRPATWDEDRHWLGQAKGRGILEVRVGDLLFDG